MTTHSVSYEGKRVLVTGGLGFIGSNLVIALANAGARVTVLDALIEGHGGLTANVEAVAERCDIRVGDLRNRAVARAAARRQEVVFHCAGQASHVASAREPALDFDLNVNASLGLLEACRDEAPDARLILISTRQVYGRATYLPVDEAHPVAPVDVNGTNKHAVEKHFEAYGT